MTFDLHVRVLAKAAERERMTLTPLSANRHSHDQGDRIKQLTEKMLQTDTKKRRKLQEEYQKAMSQAKEKHALEKKVSDSKSFLRR